MRELDVRGKVVAIGDATVESIVLVIIMGVMVVARHAPLDTIVQVGIIKHENIPVQPASTPMARVHPRARTVQPASTRQPRVLPRHPRARTVQPGKSVKWGLQNVPPSANQGHTIPVAAYVMNVRQEDGQVQ